MREGMGRIREEEGRGTSPQIFRLSAAYMEQCEPQKPAGRLTLLSVAITAKYGSSLLLHFTIDLLPHPVNCRSVATA